jgi:site-specific recombinase XerD
MLRHVRTHVRSCTSFDTPKDCPSQSKKKCPFWVEGRHNGKRWHQSLKTADEKTAIRIVNRIVETGTLEPEAEAIGIDIAEAVEAFLNEQTGRGVAMATLGSFRKFLIGSPNRLGWKDAKGTWHHRKNAHTFSATLVDFAKEQGITTLDELTPPLAAKFRQGWTVKKTTADKQTERLKTFFRFCVDQQYLSENPAESLKPPSASDNDVPVIPFTREQVASILKACGSNEYLKTFVLVMRYSGLATVDAIKLTPDRLEHNHLKLRRTKTKGWVKVLLPAVIAGRLRDLPTHSSGFWFWNKQKDSKHQTATGNMRRMLRPIFGPNGANVVLKDEEGNLITDRRGKQRYGHPYQFRHTFVLEQLEAGASLERIAELLGNTYKVVEKNYSGWVKERQTILDETVAKSWNENELAGY